eukprot:1401134-Lingulodinium_polyedra.AAC.1
MTRRSHLHTVSSSGDSRGTAVCWPTVATTTAVRAAAARAGRQRAQPPRLTVTAAARRAQFKMGPAAAGH